jgi:hypothetical protein
MFPPLLVAQMNDLVVWIVLPAFGLDYIAGGASAMKNSPAAIRRLPALDDGGARTSAIPRDQDAAGAGASSLINRADIA